MLRNESSANCQSIGIATDVKPAIRNSPESRGKRFHEETLIRRFISSLELSPDQWVLDVGSGHGNKMQWVKDASFNVHGVDINPESVAVACSRGFECMLVDEFRKTTKQYDAILAAHIVEHFSPADLLEFLDSYLDRLKVGGHIIISTPLEHANFYADFDHVKTYHPTAFINVFSRPRSQVQYHARNQLNLVDLGLRRVPKARPKYLKLYEKFYQTSIIWRMWYETERLLSRALFKFSGGVLGAATTGWIGLFEKVARNADAESLPVVEDDCD